MLNIQTDVHVHPAMLAKCSWVNLCSIAQKGSASQRTCLLEWSRTEIPAFMHRDLAAMAALAQFKGV